MRILVVSAHFPPNFVSGGTLAPQRQARGLRALRHQVGVYAGWLGGERPPLEGWSELDPTGLPVRWVVTTPWVDWSDERNFDNPGVAEDFAAHVASFRPDVVHFHALQSLGAGLLEVAADAGAKVVVTMHDFWWWCARQFLVTKELRPCCPVVSCGVCPCEVDRPWLEARDRALRARLARADAVLAPSAAVAEAFAANGVDPERLRVDENGVPLTVQRRLRRPSRPRASDGTLRLTYAGGPHPLKGAAMVFEAATVLADRPGWHLRAYGAQPYVDEAGVDVDALPVTVLPPFAEGELATVLDDADVVLVPSVAQESYSLVTREALTCGVPVVCTDTPGPLEVVEHGRNGLVVPAGDSAQLADAVRRLLDEPELLPALRKGCGPVPLRSVEEQVAGLEGLYRELLGRPPDGGARRRSVARVLFLVGIEGAPLRYRARLPAEALGLLGVHADVRHYRDPELPALADQADAVVVYRVPATAQVLELLDATRRRGTPLFFDVDDLIFDPAVAEALPALAALPADERRLYLEGVHRYRTTMEACDVFIGTTPELCRQAEALTGLPAERFPNGVGVVLGQLSDAALARPRSPGPVRLGYLSGTSTHDHDWLHVEPTVAGLLEARPEVELWLAGHVNPSPALDRFGDQVRRLPLLAWTDLPGLLRDLDVNLAPLAPDSVFNEAKSAIKWLEAALTATPTVASPTEPFREAIRHGESGLLAGTEDEWAQGLRLLVDDEALRHRLGSRARRDALLRWSPHRQAHRYLEILELGPHRRRRPSPPWDPVLLDEPYVPVALEPYGAQPAPPPPTAPPPPPPVPTGLERVRSVADRGRRSLEEDGVVVTARRAVRLARRQWPRVEAGLRRAAGAGRARATAARRRRPHRP